MTMRPMLARLSRPSLSSTFAAAVAAAMLLAAGPARGQTFATYSFTVGGPSPVAYSTSVANGVTTASFTGSSDVLFSFTDGPAAGVNIPATMTLTVKTTLPVEAAQGASIEYLNRAETLTFVGTGGAYNGINLLTVKFNGGMGSTDPNAALVQSSTALGGKITFTSAVAGYAFISDPMLGKDISMAFATTPIAIKGKFYAPFTTISGSGQFGLD